MIVRLLVRWLLNALTLFGIAYFAPRFGILDGFSLDDDFVTAVIAVAILAILNLTVRPILKLLSLPVTCLTFGLFTLVINALMMMLTAEFVRGFRVSGFLNALIASVLFAILSSILNSLFNAKDEDD